MFASTLGFLAVTVLSIPLPATTAGRLTQGWLDAFNSGDSSSIATFVNASYSSAALMGRPASAMVERERWRAMNLGAVEVVRIEESTDSTLRVLVREPAVDSWGHLAVTLTQAPERKIAGVSLTRNEVPPADLSAHGRLDEAAVLAGIDSMARTLTRDGRFSGAVGVVHHGRVVSTRSYGMADRAAGTKNVLDTRFQLASVGKVFTAVAIAKLVEEGKLSYDDVIAKWIPEYANATAARTVTLRHLLMHSSGIGDFFFNPAYGASNKETLSLADHLAFFAADSLRFAPGTRWEYSNSNYLLLGLIAERASRRPYAELYERVSFAPAEMHDTWAPSRAQPRANNYTWYGPMRALDLSGARVAVNEPPRGTPAGGGVSTIGDMSQYAAALLGGKLVSRASLDTMIGQKSVSVGEGAWAAYGFDSVERWRSSRVADKNGYTYGTLSMFELYPDDDYAVVVLSNTDMWGGESVVTRARELITRR